MDKIKAGLLFFILLIPISVWAGTDPVQKPEQARSVKIVGGSDSPPGEWPWMAALVNAGAQSNYDGQFCGATLIHPSWVVTAAHCLEGLTAEEIVVVLGVNNLKTDQGVRIGVKTIHPHPSHNPNTMDSDMALLELIDAAPSNYLPVNLWGSGIKAGTEATVLGWGNMSDVGSEYPEILQQVSMPVVSNETCNIPYNNGITDTMLCAGYEEGGKDSCQGDSGGPLVVNSKNTWYLAGIVSWGEGCARKGYYGVYTRVSEFISHINTTMGRSDANVYGISVNNDSASTAANTSVTIDVLANDSGNGKLTLTHVANPQHGSAAIREGAITYTPGTLFIGTDSFDYTVSDGIAAAEASVTVNVVFDQDRNCFIDTLNR